MTTIVAVQGDGDVLLGWDSQLTVENEMYTWGLPKVFVRKGIIYGVSGVTRAGDLVATADFPEYDGSDAWTWVIKEWVPAFREVIEEDPALFDREDRSLKAFGLIMVVDSQAFKLDSLLSPTKTVPGIYTSGSGGDYAKGALAHGATVLEALEVAASLDPFSAEPFHVQLASDLIRTEDI